MRNTLLACCSFVSVAVCSSAASAWHFETRLVERIGNVDMPLADHVTFDAGTTHRIRIQFGTFDDGDGIAPDGGFVAWNVGSLSTTGGGTWSRTPGRLAPFNFPQQGGANGSPVGDPFTSLTGIDNAMGAQTLPWECDGSGQPLPPPSPIVRGRNTFVSTYEISVLTPDFASTMDVTWGGQRIAVREWHFEPLLSQQPDCDTGTAGSATFLPLVTQPLLPPFTQSLRIQVVPTPAGSALLALGCGFMSRRRR